MSQFDFLEIRILLCVVPVCWVELLLESDQLSQAVRFLCGCHTQIFVIFICASEQSWYSWTPEEWTVDPTFCNYNWEFNG